MALIEHATYIIDALERLVCATPHVQTDQSGHSIDTVVPARNFVYWTTYKPLATNWVVSWAFSSFIIPVGVIPIFTCIQEDEIEYGYTQTHATHTSKSGV